MPQYVAAISALTVMTGRIDVEADTPELAVDAAMKAIEAGHVYPDFEFVDGSRPAPGSLAVDEIRDEDDEDTIYTPPSAPPLQASLDRALAALREIAARGNFGSSPECAQIADVALAEIEKATAQ